MTQYAIEKNGEIVKHVVLLGDGEKDLYRKMDVQILLFETEEQATKMLEVWPKAKVVEYKQSKKQAA